ncbi:MAG: hypothetical protein V3V59_01295 [Thermodesulfovibrionales bacterium]
MKKITTIFFIVTLLFINSCVDTKSRAKGVFMLVDTSGTYTAELKKAQAIINYLLGTLQPGDSFAVARIDTGSFSEKDIVSKVIFDGRPSRANTQKRAFQEQIDKFMSNVKGSPYTDITGGILQATEFINETGAGEKFILIFSDLKEEIREGYVRDIPLQVNEFTVIALNVTKLRSDNVDPREYMDRLEDWRKKIEAGGGKWKVINDLERLERIFD